MLRTRYSLPLGLAWALHADFEISPPSFFLKHLELDVEPSSLTVTSSLALVPGPGSAHGMFELPACMLDGGSNHVCDAHST
jgi:hypothetical protein